MLEEILVLLYKLLGSEPAILVEEVNLEDISAILGICLIKAIPDEQWDDISEHSETNVGSESVVVIRIEPLH